MDHLASFANPRALSMPPVWHRGSVSSTDASGYYGDDDSGYSSEDVEFQALSDHFRNDFQDHLELGHENESRRQYSSPTFTDPYEYDPLPFRPNPRSSSHDRSYDYDFPSTPRSYSPTNDEQKYPFNDYPPPQTTSRTSRNGHTAKTYTQRRRERSNAVSKPCSSVQIDSEDHRSRVPAALPSLSERFEEVVENEEGEEEEDEEGQEEEAEESARQSDYIHNSPHLQPTQPRPHQLNPNLSHDLLPGCRHVPAYYPHLYPASPSIPHQDRIPSPVYGLPMSPCQRQPRVANGDQRLGRAWLDLKRRRERLERRLERVEEEERRLWGLEDWSG